MNIEISDYGVQHPPQDPVQEGRQRQPVTKRCTVLLRRVSITQVDNVNQRSNVVQVSQVFVISFKLFN